MAGADETTTAPVRTERMSDLDALIWSVERDPRLRSTFVAIALVEGPVDRVALRHRLDRASRRAPRLRQRAVTDPLPIAPPRWETDTDFCPAAHLRVTTLGGQADRADLLDLAAAIAAEPFDRDRPLWEVTIVDGLAGDAPTAVILKCHHALADGVGGFDLAMEIFDLDGTEPPSDLPPEPPPTPTPLHPLEDAVRHETAGALESARRALDTLAVAGIDPLAAARHAGELVAALDRLLRVPLTSGRHRPRHRGADELVTGFVDLSVPLEDLRSAGRAAGGTINDAFVAGVVIGTARHLARLGRLHDRIEVAVPINVRPRSGQNSGGNRWAPGRVSAPIDDPDGDPRRVLSRICTITRTLRNEPVHELLDPAASVLRHVPTSISAPMMASIMGGVDVTASNVPGSPVPLSLVGRRVRELIPFGPLVGAPINATLLSVGTDANIGIAHDTAAIDDGDLLLADYRAAFAELLA